MSGSTPSITRRTSYSPDSSPARSLAAFPKLSSPFFEEDALGDVLLFSEEGALATISPSTRLPSYSASAVRNFYAALSSSSAILSNSVKTVNIFGFASLNI
ncbi:hypothetical protein HWX41_13855 [Bacillus paramycoides]|nr:hypothetical protein [Bacillus paramycoides]